MRRFTAFLIIAVAASYPDRGMAYEEVTHEKLAEAAVRRSVLSVDRSILRGLGLPPSIEDNADLFPNSEGKSRNILNLLMDGARFEDGKFRLSLKPLFHFFDPLNDEGLFFFTSPTWALEDKGSIHLLQKHSYSDARDFLYKALTATNAEDRKINFGRTFESLGHVIHHLQDMAQPQHVRLDAHLKLDLTDEELPFENRSRYEIHTEDKATGRLPGGLPYDGYAPINNKDDAKFLTTPRSFWHTKQKNPLEGEGIAEFTNTNFVSQDTNFLGAFQNGQLIARPNWRYSLPEPSPVTPRFEDAGALLQSIGKTPPAECAPPNNPCVMAFFAAEVKDNYRGTRTVNPKASTASIFDQDLQFHGIRVPYPNLDKCANPADTSTCETIETNQIFSLNRFNFDEAHKFLIPRAVAYSAGLIDYFFRGRLEAEDVEFTDTGVRLRVRNGIDPQATPAWANEILYGVSAGSGGTLIIAFEYKDSTGTTRYGASEPVNLTENLAPGQVSQNAYAFALSIPEGATEVKYRLVFRGKVGQEEGAVAVGIVEPIAGFLVTPNHRTMDGIFGARAIFKLNGRWRVDPKAGIQAGNVDWKGWYIRGRPTRVVSWRGPSKRYFPDIGFFDFGREIYKNGELWSVAPRPVLGAAIGKDNGIEWLIVICSDGTRDIVYRRVNTKNHSEAMFDPLLAPEGWHEIANFEPLPGTLRPDRPWFFNGTATEAQTMRRSAVDNPTNDPNKLTRLKISISGAAASIRDLGNTPGHNAVFTEEDSQWNGTPSTCVIDQTGTATRSLTERWKATGEDYVVAVDYQDNREVLAKVARVGEAVRVRSMVAAWKIIFCNVVDGSITYSILYTEDGEVTSSIQTLLKFNGMSIPLTAPRPKMTASLISRSLWKMRPWGPFILDASETEGVSNLASNSHSVRLTYLDLRYELYAAAAVMFNQEIRTTITESQICFSHLQDRVSQHDVVHYLGAKIVGPELVSGPRTDSCFQRRGGEMPINLHPLVTVFDSPRPPDVSLHSARGSWLVDTGGNLLVSQESLDHGTFAFLTDGDLPALFPIAPEEPIFFPAGVIR